MPCCATGLEALICQRKNMFCFSATEFFISDKPHDPCGRVISSVAMRAACRDSSLAAASRSVMSCDEYQQRCKAYESESGITQNYIPCYFVGWIIFFVIGCSSRPHFEILLVIVVNDLHFTELQSHEVSATDHTYSFTKQ